MFEASAICSRYMHIHDLWGACEPFLFCHEVLNEAQAWKVCCLGCISR